MSLCPPSPGRRVVIVPGYGLAVAQGQAVIAQIASFLISKKIQTRFAIHPVAGRLPGEKGRWRENRRGQVAEIGECNHYVDRASEQVRYS